MRVHLSANLFLFLFRATFLFLSASIFCFISLGKTKAANFFVGINSAFSWSLSLLSARLAKLLLRYPTFFEVAKTIRCRKRTYEIFSAFPNRETGRVPLFSSEKCNAIFTRRYNLHDVFAPERWKLLYWRTNAYGGHICDSWRGYNPWLALSWKGQQRSFFFLSPTNPKREPSTHFRPHPNSAVWYRRTDTRIYKHGG